MIILQDFYLPYISFVLLLFDFFLLWQIKERISGLLFFSNPFISKVKSVLDVLDFQSVLIFLFCYSLIVVFSFFVPFLLLIMIALQGVSMMTNMFILAIIFADLKK